MPVLIFGTIFLAAPIVAGSIALWAIGRWLGWKPAGVPPLLGLLLVTALGFGGFYLALAIDSLVITPALRQREFLGTAHGTPLTLVYYNMSGFQDPGQRWEYRLSSAEQAAFRRRCLRTGFENQPGGECVLFSKEDERWYGYVAVRGSRLVVEDGLW